MQFATRKTNRRFIIWMLLASYVFLLGGICGIEPAEKSGTMKNGERFPCENCPCGCSTAEFCWDQCCCHSDAEKIEWAAANDVTPPTFLTARVAKSSTTVACAMKADDASSSKCCCCSVKPKESSKPKKKSGTPKTVAEPATTSVVLFWKAAQCRGVQSFWKLLSMAVVTNKPRTVVSPVLRSTGLVIADESAESAVYAPIPPVPWG